MKCRGSWMREGDHTCYACAFKYDASTADIVGSMVYAVSGSQSNKMMRAYKDIPPSAQMLQRVTSLVSLGVRAHFDCASSLVGATLTKWATVPSTKTVPYEHPLHAKVLTPLLGAEHEIVVVATESAKGKSESERRELDTSMYEVRSEVPPTHGFF